MNNIEKLSLKVELQVKQSEFKRLDTYYKNRFFNYPSRRSLAWSLGLGIIIFTLSLRLMQKAFKEKDKYLRYADMAESFTGAIIGGYFFVWILDPVDRLDLPYTYYIILTVLGGVILAIMAYFISKSRYNFIEKLKQKNRAVEGLLKGFIEVNKVKYQKKKKADDTVQAIEFKNTAVDQAL